MSVVQKPVDGRRKTCGEKLSRGIDDGGQRFVVILRVREHLLRREELRVPEDIEILCQQNTKLAKLADPALSVLAPTGYQVGMVGAKCLMDHLDRGDTLAPLQLVAPKLVKRGSIK